MCGWGSQVDTRAITDVASRDSVRAARLVHPEQVAAYLAKYLTKATEDFGLPARVRSVGHARLAGASAHAIRIIETAQDLAAEHDAYGRLLANLATLGYRGHPITKSRAYSVTFGQIRRVRRRVRRRFRHNPAGLDPEADIRQVLDVDGDLPPTGSRSSPVGCSSARATSTSTPPRPPSTRRRWLAPDDSAKRSAGFPRREA
jgi:hypothetical protein